MGHIRADFQFNASSFPFLSANVFAIVEHFEDHLEHLRYSFMCSTLFVSLFFSTFTFVCVYECARDLWMPFYCGRKMGRRVVQLAITSFHLECRCDWLLIWHKRCIFTFEGFVTDYSFLIGAVNSSIYFEHQQYSPSGTHHSAFHVSIFIPFFWFNKGFGHGIPNCIKVNMYIPLRYYWHLYRIYATRATADEYSF